MLELDEFCNGQVRDDAASLLYMCRSRSRVIPLPNNACRHLSQEKMRKAAQLSKEELAMEKAKREAIVKAQEKKRLREARAEALREKVCITPPRLVPARLPPTLVCFHDGGAFIIESSPCPSLRI